MAVAPENSGFDIKTYLNEKISYYEHLLSQVETSKETERKKPVDERRDFRMMFKLDKDETVYSTCLEELKSLKKNLYE